ncbi:MAG: hypothetical protein PVJ32_07510 [Anaerolineales bacterium]
MSLKTIGRYLFLLCFLLALLMGYIPAMEQLWLILIVVLIGLVGAILWLDKGDETAFLILTLALATVPAAIFAAMGPSQILGYIATFFSAAGVAAVSASMGIILKNIYRWIIP